MLAAFVFIDIWRWFNSRDVAPNAKCAGPDAVQISAVQGPTVYLEYASTPPTHAVWRWFGSQALRYYLPLGVVVALYGTMRLNAVGFGSGAHLTHPVVNPLVDATVLERIVTPFLLLGKYLSLLAWPARLSSDYSAPSLMPTTNLLNPGVLLGLMVAGLGTLLVLTRARRWPRAVALIVLFALSYALVANFLRIGTIFGERLFYWPSVFVLMFAGYLLARGWDLAATLPTRVPVRAAGTIALAGLCLAMSVRTYYRNTDWQSNLHLAIATARDNPGSAKACFWAGSVLVNQAPREEWVQLGLRLLHDAVDMRKDFGNAYFELAKYYGRRQEFNDSFLWLCRAAQWQGGLMETRMALREVKNDLKRLDDKTYMPAVDAYLKEHPKDPAGYLARGMAQAARGQTKEADATFVRGLELDPHFVEMRFEYGLLKRDEGDLPAAMFNLRVYNMTISYNVEARLDLARVLMTMDPKTYPFALAEADMNLTKAEGMFYADYRVRMCREEYRRRKAQVEAAADHPLAAPKNPMDEPHARLARPLVPLGMAN